LNNQESIDKADRRRMLDKLAELNGENYKEFGDPEINTKIQQYEMAFRMQTAVPDITDLSQRARRYREIIWCRLSYSGYLCRQLLTGAQSYRRTAFASFSYTTRDGMHMVDLPKSNQRSALDTDQSSAALITT
jgi:hypothetical protein